MQKMCAEETNVSENRCRMAGSAREAEGVSSQN